MDVLAHRWACPRHPDEPLKFNGGRLWCERDRADVPDAVKVVIVREDDWRGAVEALREYGRHRSDCNVTMARRGFEIGAECTCGFDAALGGQS